LDLKIAAMANTRNRNTGAPALAVVTCVTGVFNLKGRPNL